MADFDADKSGYLSIDEGVALSRAIGVRDTLPGDDFMFELIPGNYEQKSVKLLIYSKRSERTGQSRYISYHPVYERVWVFPLSKLEELTKNE